MRIYRVEVVVYAIDVDESGDETSDDVIFEEDVFDCEDDVKAVRLAELMVEKTGKL
jgi:hypothetical protein